MQLLITQGIDVNYVDPHGQTALHRSAYNGHLHIVKVLIDVPQCDPNRQVGFSGFQWGSVGISESSNIDMNHRETSE